MSNESNPAEVENQPIGDVIDDLMHQSQTAMESGARASAELQELKRRAEDAMNWRKQWGRHGQVMLAGIAAGSLLVFLLTRRPR